MAVTTIGGNVLAAGVLSVTLDVTTVNAATTVEQTFTVPGLQVTDFVFANPGANFSAGVGVAGARVSAPDTLSIRLVNATAGALNPPAVTFTVLVVRPESGSFTGFAP